MSWVEQLCLRSFVAKGHKVILYTNGEVDNIPEGVEQRPDTEIWNPGRLVTYQGSHLPYLKGNLALHSDLFRYHLLNKTDYIWADTDAYCHQPFPNEPWFFARDQIHQDAPINGGVLRLPKNSQTLKLLVENFANENDEYPILPWKSKGNQFRQRLRKKLGRLPHLSELDFATPGPIALTKCLEMTGEVHNAMPCSALYPLPVLDSYFVFDDEKDFSKKYLSDDCLSVHLYTTRLNSHHKDLIFFPPKNSWLVARARELGVDPAQTPEIIKKKPQSQTITSIPKNKDEIPTSTLPTIASWWHGWRMSWTEQLCLLSFVAKGHKVILYTNGEVDNVPEGVEQRPDTEIWNPGKIITYQGDFMPYLKGSPAIHADLFRYHLLNKTDYIWVDTDAYCHQPFPNNPWCFAKQTPDPGQTESDLFIANGVMRLPKNSKTLKLLTRTFLGEGGEYPVMPWKSKTNQLRQRWQKKQGRMPTHISRIPWGSTGPLVFTKFLEMTGEIKNALPPQSLYPLSSIYNHLVFKNEKDLTKYLPHDCLSVHLYSSGLYAKHKDLIVNPPEDSWLRARARELGVDPALAPDRIMEKPQSQTIVSIPKNKVPKKINAKNKNEIPMIPLPTIASWWSGWRMGWIEQVCLRSYVAQGHRVILYTNGEVDNVPEGVEQQPDTEIWNPGRLITYEGDDIHNYKGSPALHTDLFRYHLLNKTDYIWVDTDAYCHQPFPNKPWVLAKHAPNPGEVESDVRVACGVLRLPKDSKTLTLLTQTFLSEDGEHPILPWESKIKKLRQRWHKRRGLPLPHISRLPWGSLGPLAMTQCLKMTGEIKHVMRAQTLYPLPGLHDYFVFKNEKDLLNHLSDDCMSVHLFSSHLYEAYKDLIVNPPKNSWLIARARELGVDPALAPDRIKDKPQSQTIISIPKNKNEIPAITHPTIASWWSGWRMGWTEQVCLRSFVAKGHKVILYTHGDVDNVPEGVEQRPDEEIWNPKKIITYDGYDARFLKFRGSPALHTDLFRYHLLNKTDYIWVDTDAYCHQTFPNNPWFFAKQSPNPGELEADVLINGAVLRLPKNSQTLKLLTQTFLGEDGEYPILPWLSQENKLYKKRRKRLGILPDISRLTWGSLGPIAMTKCLKITGEVNHAMPAQTLYPLPGLQSHFVFKNEKDLTQHLSSDCLSVHLFSSHLYADYKDLIHNPPEDSWLLARARELSVDPALAPDRIMDKP